MIKTGLSLLLTLSLANEIWLPKQMAQLSVTQCSQTSHSSTIKSYVDHQNPKETFPLYFFSENAFDSKKPSALIIDGGPGQLTIVPKNSIYEKLSAYNIIHFHYRASGCSYFPASKSYDNYITSVQIAHDIDLIRKHLFISKWEGIVAYSYGTRVSRVYSYLFPNNIQVQILDGLLNNLSFDDENDPLALDRKLFSEKLERSISLAKNDLLRFYSPSEIQSISKMILADYSDKDFGYHVHNYLANDAGIKKSRLKRSRLYSLAIYKFTNMGFDSTSEMIQMAHFLIYSVRPKSQQPKTFVNVIASLKSFDRSLFSYLFDDYNDPAKTNRLISNRVFEVLYQKDHALNVELCSSVSTVILSGGFDQATPSISHFQSQFEECLKGPLQFYSSSQSGHGLLADYVCTPQFIHQILSRADKQLVLRNLKGVCRFD